jgi:mRNA-degrading endonuclease RelE of RelBE toxin-antitoxin system
MKHLASPSFWERYRNLPEETRRTADKNFQLLKTNSRHPSLHLKKVGRYWSVRIGRRYRALGVDIPEGVLWFWIGTHAEYDELVK